MRRSGFRHRNQTLTMEKPKLPAPIYLADDEEYEIMQGALVHVVPIKDEDGMVRRVKARFTNRAVLRMTLAEPYEGGDDGPLTFEASAGPLRF